MAFPLSLMVTDQGTWWGQNKQQRDSNAVGHQVRHPSNVSEGEILAGTDFVEKMGVVAASLLDVSCKWLLMSCSSAGHCC